MDNEDRRSRQLRHMQKKVARGICAICTKPRVTAWLCETHRQIHNAQQQKGKKG